MADSIDYNINFDAAAAQKALDGIASSITGIGDKAQQSFARVGNGMTILEQQMARIAKADAIKTLGMQFERTEKSSDAAAAAFVRNSIALGENAIAAEKAAAAQKDNAAASNQVTASANKAADGSNSLSSAFKQLSVAAGIAAVIRGVDSQIKALIDSMVTAQQTMARLNFADKGDPKKVATDYQFVSDMAERLGLRLNDVAASYSKFAIAGEQAGMSGDKLKAVFTGVAEAAKVMHLTQDQTTSMMDALTRMATREGVSLMQLERSMGKDLPMAMEAAANATGLTAQQFRTQMAKGTVDIGSFFDAFGYQLRMMAQKDLPESVDSLESEMNRFSSQVDKMRNEAGNGELGASLAGAVKSFTAALKDPSINESFQAIGKGFASVLTSASSNLPRVGSIFVDMTDTMGTAFAIMFTKLISDFEAISLKSSAFFNELKADTTRALGGSIFTSWMVGGPENADNSASESDKRAKQAKIALDNHNKNDYAGVAIATIRDDYEKRNVARAAQDSFIASDTTKQVSPPIGDKPQSAKITPKAAAKADPMEAAQRSFETAEAEAQMKISAAQRSTAKAQLDADLAKENISYEEHAKQVATIEKAAVDEQIAIQEKLRARRQAEEDTALKKGGPKNNAEALKLKGEVEKIDATLTALRAQKVNIDITLGGGQETTKRAAEKYLTDLNIAFQDAIGDKEGAAHARIAQSLQQSLADPKVKDHPDTQAALTRNAAQSDAAASLDGSIQAFEREKRLLDMVIQDNDDKVKRGEMTAVEAEANILKAREAVREKMQEEVNLVEKLAAATNNPDAIAAAKEMQLNVKNIASTVDTFSLSLKNGFLDDLKKGFIDLIQKGDSFSSVLKKIAASSLQKIANNQFDKGMASILKGFDTASAAGKDGGTEGYFTSLGKSLGSSFLDTINEGWSAVKSLFSSLFSSVGSGISSDVGAAAEGASSGGGLFSAFTSLFSGMATGGNIQAGSSYIVGEKGPEAFFPGTQGSMVPTDRLQHAMSALIGMNASQMPIGTMSNTLNGNLVPQQNQADTHVHIAPKVVVSSSHLIEALKHDPEFERMHVKMTVANGNKIKGAW